MLGPLVFACLDAEAAPFEAWAGELTAAFARFGVERWQPAFAFDYEVRTNWKTYVENGLDGYHIPFVHDFLAGAIDVATGENFFEAHGSYTVVGASAALTPPGMERGQFRFGMIFPNLIPVFSPIDFTYLRIDPIDAETIRLRGRAFDGGGERSVPRDFRAAAFDATNKQDIAVVERVQRGLRARGLPAARAQRCARGAHHALREAGRVGARLISFRDGGGISAPSGKEPPQNFRRRAFGRVGSEWARSCPSRNCCRNFSAALGRKIPAALISVLPPTSPSPHLPLNLCLLARYASHQPRCARSRRRRHFRASFRGGGEVGRSEGGR